MNKKAMKKVVALIMVFILSITEGASILAMESVTETMVEEVNQLECSEEFDEVRTLTRTLETSFITGTQEEFIAMTKQTVPAEDSKKVSGYVKMEMVKLANLMNAEGTESLGSMAMQSRLFEATVLIQRSQGFDAIIKATEGAGNEQSETKMELAIANTILCLAELLYGRMINRPALGSDELANMTMSSVIASLVLTPALKQYISSIFFFCFIIFSWVSLFNN